MSDPEESTPAECTPSETPTQEMNSSSIIRYSKETLLSLHDSPLVAKPPDMPPLSTWFRYLISLSFFPYPLIALEKPVGVRALDTESTYIYACITNYSDDHDAYISKSILNGSPASTRLSSKMDDDDDDGVLRISMDAHIQ